MYCIRTLPRGGMYWKIHPPRPKRFPKGGDFAPRGPRDCPRAKPEGNLKGLQSQGSTLRLSASVPEHCQCFPREDVPDIRPSECTGKYCP